MIKESTMSPGSYIAPPLRSSVRKEIIVFITVTSPASETSSSRPSNTGQVNTLITIIHSGFPFTEIKDYPQLTFAAFQSVHTKHPKPFSLI